MNPLQSGLALRQTPPFRVPAPFFLTAPLFGTAGGLLLLLDGQAVLANRWTPAMLAFTHLFTLGFMASVMSGAFMQLLPVLGGKSIPKAVPVSAAWYVLLTLGVIALCGGLYTQQVWLIHTAWLLLSGGFILFIGAAAYALWYAPHNPIIIAMRLALLSLLITVLLGLLLALLLAAEIKVNPVFFTRLHLVWGLGGWTCLLVIGVAYQVVPMFQITPQYPPKLTRFLAPALFALLMLWSGFNIAAEYRWFAGAESVAWLSGCGLAAGLIVFAGFTLYLQSKRLRKLPDITLNYWRLGMIGLIVAVLSGILPLSGAAEIFTGVLFIGSFVLPVIQGMMYKIVPFLAWLHLTNFQAEKKTKLKIPHMRGLIPDKRMKLQFWVYAGAVAVTVPALWLPLLGYAAGLLLIAAFALLEYNLFTAVRVYLNTKREIEAQRV